MDNLQDSGQKLTYAQIIQKKKEAAEALERERAAAGQPLETKGTKDEKAENGMNGEVKNSKSSVPVVSINANSDRESGSVSPRQQSLVS